MEDRIIAEVRQSQDLSTARDLDALIEDLGNARIVLLGGASHGTSEFHTWRAEITKRLIVEKGFFLVGVEGDWSACRRVNRYLAGIADHSLSPAAVLNASFERWPTWIWANREVASLTGWLRQYNVCRPAGANVARFYGLDLYDLWESLDAITCYLEQVDAESAAQARKAYECFEPFRALHEPHSARYLVPDTCREEAISLLRRVRERCQNYPEDGDAPLHARQDALVIANAQNYYHEFLMGGLASWNLRTRHMAESIRNILDYHEERHGIPGKIVVWAHNMHVGDARATDMPHVGMRSLGQLIREQFPHQVRIVGFASCRGRVIATGQWEGLMQDVELPEARQESWEYLLHLAGAENRIIRLNGVFDERRSQRAIGALYDPEHETGNYIPATLSQQYDYLVFIDESSPLHPLSLAYEPSRIPETYPSGL